MYGCKFPNKRTSLENLKKIQENRYFGSDGREYDAPTVDDMILEKESRKQDALFEQQMDAWDMEEEFNRDNS